MGAWFDLGHRSKTTILSLDCDYYDLSKRRTMVIKSMCGFVCLLAMLCGRQIYRSISEARAQRMREGPCWPVCLTCSCLM